MQKKNQKFSKAEPPNVHARKTIFIELIVIIWREKNHWWKSAIDFQSIQYVIQLKIKWLWFIVCMRINWLDFLGYYDTFVRERRFFQLHSLWQNDKKLIRFSWDFFPFLWLSLKFLFEICWSTHFCNHAGKIWISWWVLLERF